MVNPREDVLALLEEAGRGGTAWPASAGRDVRPPGRRRRRDPRRRRGAALRPDRRRQPRHDRGQAIPARLGPEQGLPPRPVLGADRPHDLAAGPHRARLIRALMLCAPPSWSGLSRRRRRASPSRSRRSAGRCPSGCAVCSRRASTCSGLGMAARSRRSRSRAPLRPRRAGADIEVPYTSPGKPNRRRCGGSSKVIWLIVGQAHGRAGSSGRRAASASSPPPGATMSSRGAAVGIVGQAPVGGRRADGDHRRCARRIGDLVDAPRCRPRRRPPRRGGGRRHRR